MLKVSPSPTTTIETEKPQFEAADIFRLYGNEYRQQYHVSQEQRIVMRDIVQCRTAMLGGHIDKCDNCCGLRISYNSCSNRHCPKCGSLARNMWLEKQKAHLLPVPYFHVVFTIDHIFNPLVRVNQRQVYTLLFRTVADTLKSFGQNYLHGEIGFISMLHILRQAQDRLWGQTVTEHIHIHCIMTGGALSNNGKQWHSASSEFLFPIIPLSAQFKDAFCDGLQKLHNAGELTFAGQSEYLADNVAFQQMLAESRAKKWQLYAKPPFGEAAQTLDYLGRYVNRIAISNHRILDVSDGRVKFSYHDYNDSKQKEMLLPAIEFMRRFLLHLLPKRFVRVRYYGFLSPRYRTKKLAQCRALLGKYHENSVIPASRADILMEMLGHDPEQCPLCGVGKMRPFEKLDAHPTRRKWQLAVH
ncbi:hypothetical protein MNBD_CHLOROFLEXI01-5156 [hydrothermal vent metagenome]|uniref:Uncharacterized protein n=1 Tax=hydrothermal vent metagenome TaxID=652676 RepID=A0A3B0VF21_9ZZZZ